MMLLCLIQVVEPAHLESCSSSNCTLMELAGKHLNNNLINALLLYLSTCKYISLSSFATAFIVLKFVKTNLKVVSDKNY